MWTENQGSEPLTTRPTGLWACLSAVEAAGISLARTTLSATGVGTCCPMTALGVCGGPGPVSTLVTPQTTDKESLRRTRGPA